MKKQTSKSVAPKLSILTLSTTKLAAVVGGIPPDPVHQRNHNATRVKTKVKAGALTQNHNLVRR